MPVNPIGTLHVSKLKTRRSKCNPKTSKAIWDNLEKSVSKCKSVLGTVIMEIITYSPCYLVPLLNPSDHHSQRPLRTPVPHHFSQLLQAQLRSHQNLLHPPISWPFPPPLPLSSHQHHHLFFVPVYYHSSITFMCMSVLCHWTKIYSIYIYKNISPRRPDVITHGTNVEFYDVSYIMPFK